MKIPFSTLSNKGLKTVLFGDSSKTLAKSFSKPFDKKTTEKLKTFREVSQLFNQSENSVSCYYYTPYEQLFDQSENSVSCYYYTPYELNKIRVKQEDLSVLHLNISSLSAHIDDLKNALSELRIKFDITCIYESKLSQKNPQTTNINLVGYNIEQTPTESSAGGVLFYISQMFSYKPRKDLQTYCPKKFESGFIELTIPNKPNFIVGTVYKHPSMQHYKFNNDFPENILNKIQTEKKFSILAGDLKKYSKTTGINQYLEIILSHNFLPQTTLPTRVTGRTATLIDNILINSYENKCTSGNITTSLSDHLPQFLITNIQDKKQLKSSYPRLQKC